MDVSSPILPGDRSRLDMQHIAVKHGDLRLERSVLLRYIDSDIRLEQRTNAMGRVQDFITTSHQHSTCADERVRHGVSHARQESIKTLMKLSGTTNIPCASRQLLWGSYISAAVQ